MGDARRVLHLMASPFFGGPERQMLTLTRHLPKTTQSYFATFAEGGKAEAFRNQARDSGFECVRLEQNFPRLLRSTNEVASLLKRLDIDLLTCSGYKPDIVGWAAAKRVGLPVVVISHGWTGATRRVKVYEALDKRIHALADAVVCVSDAQHRRVMKAGVDERKLVTIANAVDESAFAAPEPARRQSLEKLFPIAPTHIVGMASRLSIEKGVDVFIDAAIRLARSHPSAGFVVFGDGPLAGDLQTRIAREKLADRIILAGFNGEAAKYFGSFDIFVLSSRTEGLPIALLEACAAGVPVVASRVGGIPEVLTEGVSGHMVDPDRPDLLANGIATLLDDAEARSAFGRAAQARVRQDYFAANQSLKYQALFDRLCDAQQRRSRPI